MTAADRTLLLIGGSGFFGKSVLDARRRGRLAQFGIGRVLVAARRAPELRATHPRLVADGVELIAVDAARADDLPSADIVLHMASSTDARRYAEDPAGEAANVTAAVDAFAAVARRRYRRAKLIYASSGAVYGQQPAGLLGIPEDFRPSAVADMAAAKHSYAEAKRAAEARIIALAADGVPALIARCFAFVGVHLPRDQHFAIGNFLADGLAGRPIRVQARKRVYRSYMHADDLVDWLLSLADAADASAPAVNVGSDEAVTVHDLAARVAARFGVPVDAEPIDDPAVDRYVPDTGRAAALGLTLRHDLASAIDDVATRLAMPGSTF